MRKLVATLGLSLLLAGQAHAIDCDEWERIASAQKGATVEGMVEARLESDVAKRYTSKDPVAIRMCMRPRIQRVVMEFDQICSEGLEHGMDALDDTFQQYFRSCVQ